jgi:predicted deacylase
VKPIRFRASSPSRNLDRISAFAGAFALVALLFCAQAQASSFTYFEGTQHPITVHTLHGSEPGPTVMVQGGIQGDEVAGFITAQLLTAARVTRGTLIVVPRANVPSIHHRVRQVNVDLNRRFDREYDDFFEDRLARVIRHLVAQSDAFIHLHEGSGFYSPTFVNDLRNPRRWGQSIIIDTDVYEETVDLSGLVQGVLARLNPLVRPASYRFELFNTDTFSLNSIFGAEMRKTLTCHALTAHRIPALAIEVSKSISSLDWKVREQLRATVMFLEHFGVHVEPPCIEGMSFDAFAAAPPEVRVNGQRFAPGGVITVEAGAPLRVEVATSGEDARMAPVPGLFAEGRPLVDLTRSPHLPLEPFGSFELRSDGELVGRATARFAGKGPDTAKEPVLFVLWHNNRLKRLAPGQVLHALEGDQLIIEGVRGGRDEIVNIKGIVTRPGRNTGQDANVEIVLDSEMFIPRFLLKSGPDKTRIQVVRETPGARGAEFLIELSPRRVEALRLLDPAGRTVFVAVGDSAPLLAQPGTWTLDAAWSNGEQDKLLVMADGLPLRFGETFVVGPGRHTVLNIRQATTFKPLGEVLLAPASMAARSSQDSRS